MIYSFNELAFTVLSVDEYRHENGSYHVAARPYAAFSLRTKGEGEFTIGNVCFVSKPNDVLFIPQGVAYDAVYRDSVSIVVHFCDCNYSIPENISSENAQSFRILFEQAMRDWKNSFSANGVKSVVYQVLYTLETEKSGILKNIRETDPVFSEIVDYVKTHFDDASVTLSSLSEIFFISEATVRRKFHRYFNMSFVRYVSRLRFDKAFSMIESANKKVSEVAFACGFSDEKYFSRAFKKHFGVSPKTLLGKRITL